MRLGESLGWCRNRLVLDAGGLHMKEPLYLRREKLTGGSLVPVVSRVGKGDEEYREAPGNLLTFIMTSSHHSHITVW
jgi:hypothetical protein